MRRRLVDPDPEPDELDEFEADDKLVDDALHLHGGLWARPDHGEGLRCHEHGLRPEDH